MSSTSADPPGASTPAGSAPRVFLDSNVLGYCADAHDPQRQRRCRQHLFRLRSGGRAVISTQVLQEFFVTATRKLGVSVDDARQLVSDFGRLPTVTINPHLIDQAIACHRDDRIAFWDALIVVAAEAAGCSLLLTEDLNPGQTLRGVRVVAPADTEAL